jgi:DNA-binding beta-propeller fold protein YncE
MPNYRIIASVIAATVMLTVLTPAVRPATVEWEIIKSLDTGDRPPLDVAVSPDGKSIFVLTEKGQIWIYTNAGDLAGKITVGSQAERIAVDPDGERLYVTNRPNKRVDVILVDMIRDISLSGAPFKGNAKAPVVIAVFSDFQ